MIDLSGFQLSESQRAEMLVAYDENHEGFEHVVRRARNTRTPEASLTTMIRRGEHDAEKGKRKREAPPSRALEDVARIAAQAYETRLRKYPATSDRGWTDDDAIQHGVTIASTWNRTVEQDDIEREMRRQIGKPWDKNSDPALGTGCPPALLANMRAKFSGIGRMPQRVPAPTPTLAETLARRRTR